MAEDSVLDTTIHEPPMAAGEVDMSLFALERSRAQFAWKCGGLDAAGLGQPHPPSAMTLGGLLKHLAWVEDNYTSTDFAGQPIGPPWDAVDFRAEPSGESPNLRRVLADLHDENARGVGHADLLREAVDGLVGEDPPQPR